MAAHYYLTPVVPATRRKEIVMSRFRKLTYTLWHCQYHFFGVSKYRYRFEKYWGNHFRALGYCVDTVGLNTEMIRKYVKYQEKRKNVFKNNSS